ncbi:MAG: hypothetical protein ACLSHW_11335 [Lachnospiraceae bacterium]
MRHMDHLLVAPKCLQNKVLDLIDEEIADGKGGKSGLHRNQDQFSDR